MSTGNEFKAPLTCPPSPPVPISIPIGTLTLDGTKVGVVGGNQIDLAPLFAGLDAGQGDKHFPFEQQVAMAQWDITHNLGKIPNVVITDNSKQGIFPGDIIYTSLDTLSLIFSAPFSGYAYLN